MTARRYAILDKDGLVVNVILLETGSDWPNPEGCTRRLAPDYVSVGWSRIDGE